MFSIIQPDTFEPFDVRHADAFYRFSIKTIVKNMEVGEHSLPECARVIHRPFP
jgi:hypothetical protein